MRDGQLPDLTFPFVKLGSRVAPWDLRPLLYKGGAAAHVTKVAALIATGKLGSPRVKRIELVEKIHEEILAAMTYGGSKNTAETSLLVFRYFFKWADSEGYSLTLNNVVRNYVRWSDHLLHRVRVTKDLLQMSAYTQARSLGSLLDKALERGRPIITSTRLTQPPSRKSARGVEADKQNLQDTFAFGHMLLDIMDGLTLDALWGKLPVRIPFRTGQELVEWSRLRPPEKKRLTNPQNRRQRLSIKSSTKIRSNYEADRTLRTRFSLANLRIEAELLFFIAQTGMNRAQAHQLKIRHFSYSSTIDGYQVRDYKHRRRGEVLFEIFSGYKALFENYLRWRKSVFPNDSNGLLFPLVRTGGRAEDKPPSWDRIKNSCKKLGIRFIPPSQLRNTRINWFLRRSGDTDLTAEQAQHSKQTLIHLYEEPNLHRTMTEVVRYWQAADPIIIPPAPGICTGSPMPVDNIQLGTTKPDCIHPSGCLWCEYHRDVDSFDYVWSASSFRHLKSIELVKYHPPQKHLPTHPALYAIERLSDKLRWFQHSNDVRKGWVEESLARVEEGDYHPTWGELIQSIEDKI
ncbi:MAG: site-specific integrase [Proteobacteria bacterium]|nr:site-specific integrase [Pseudomonadota bacterium]